MNLGRVHIEINRRTFNIYRLSYLNDKSNVCFYNSVISIKNNAVGLKCTHRCNYYLVQIDGFSYRLNRT